MTTTTRTRRVMILVNDQEHQLFSDLAHTQRVSVGELVRRLVVQAARDALTDTAELVAVGS